MKQSINPLPRSLADAFPNRRLGPGLSCVSAALGLVVRYRALQKPAYPKDGTAQALIVLTQWLIAPALLGWRSWLAAVVAHRPARTHVACPTEAPRFSPP
ncbi:hypothetical protein [Denitromonas iodatirespirans]|uniref:Uncharacterized protein n=1 Tax=Denitromonas iodatirespirans TaxID=2795389 RepID=A0A944DD91_DENI1|nr:hypothetical protein [Denitromonas iodatirespirans]MBT0962946.1 hypothetical protein [Denitromonas iodatirespirans]